MLERVARRFHLEAALCSATVFLCSHVLLCSFARVSGEQSFVVSSPPLVSLAQQIARFTLHFAPLSLYQVGPTFDTSTGPRWPLALPVELGPLGGSLAQLGLSERATGKEWEELEAREIISGLQVARLFL